MKIFKYCLLFFLFAVSINGMAQSADSLYASVQNISGKFYSKVEKKYAGIDKNLSRKSIKYLKKLQKEENRINRKLTTLDPAIESSDQTVTSKYAEFSKMLKENGKVAGKVNLNEYNSYIDTLSTSLSFLKKFSSVSANTELPVAALDKLKDKFNESEKINEFISERKQRIQRLLSSYTTVPASLKKQYDKLSRSSYYYSAQVQEYKEVLKDPAKIEQKVLSGLSKLPAFQAFWKKNSQLAQMFPMPTGFGTIQGLSGLQARAEIQNSLRLVGVGSNPQYLQQQFQQANTLLDRLKKKVTYLGGTNGSGDMIIPDFVPNSQHTKQFLKRLEYGFNLQSAPHNSLLPATTNIALTLGYKMSDKAQLGLGSSYVLGLGSGINHLKLSSQGVGFRSYVEIKAVGRIWITGGFEYTYYGHFSKLTELENPSIWQKSGLIGVTRKTKIGKKTVNMQLLYDLLNRGEEPGGQALKYRIGYTL